MCFEACSCATKRYGFLWIASHRNKQTLAAKGASLCSRMLMGFASKPYPNFISDGHLCDQAFLLCQEPLNISMAVTCVNAQAKTPAMLKSLCFHMCVACACIVGMHHKEILLNIEIKHAYHVSSIDTKEVARTTARTMTLKNKVVIWLNSQIGPMKNYLYLSKWQLTKHQLLVKRGLQQKFFFNIICVLQNVKNCRFFHLAKWPFWGVIIWSKFGLSQKWPSWTR